MNEKDLRTVLTGKAMNGMNQVRSRVAKILLDAGHAISTPDTDTTRASAAEEAPLTHVYMVNSYLDNPRQALFYVMPRDHWIATESRWNDELEPEIENFLKTIGLRRWALGVYEIDTSTTHLNAILHRLIADTRFAQVPHPTTGHPA